VCEARANPELWLVCLAAGRQGSGCEPRWVAWSGWLVAGSLHVPTLILMMAGHVILRKTLRNFQPNVPASKHCTRNRNPLGLETQ
jgi:threonine/homoserine/homoserine lactone efflux protein